MKKYILVILLLFCFGFTQAPHLKVLSRINATSGEATPDIEINMDTGDADCTAVGWSYEYSAANVACNDTDHRDGGSGYAVQADEGNTTGVCVAFDGAKTEIWVEFFLHVVDGDSTWGNTNRFFGFDDACDAAESPADIFFQVRDDSGYKWGWNAGSNVYGEAASNPDQDMMIRLHAVRHDSAGVVELWESTNGGANWTKKIDHSSQDTALAESWSTAHFGFNNGNGLPETWHFDSVKIYYSDPSWSF